MAFAHCPLPTGSGASCPHSARASRWKPADEQKESAKTDETRSGDGFWGACGSGSGSGNRNGNERMRMRCGCGCRCKCKWSKRASANENGEVAARTEEQGVKLGVGIGKWGSRAKPPKVNLEYDVHEASGKVNGKVARVGRRRYGRIRTLTVDTTARLRGKPAVQTVRPVSRNPILARLAHYHTTPAPTRLCTEDHAPRRQYWLPPAGRRCHSRSALAQRTCHGTARWTRACG